MFMMTVENLLIDWQNEKENDDFQKIDILWIHYIDVELFYLYFLLQDMYLLIGFKI